MIEYVYATIINTLLWALVGWLAWLVYNGGNDLLVIPMVVLPMLFRVIPEKEQRGKNETD